jgi:hypothetical protein
VVGDRHRVDGLAGGSQDVRREARHHVRPWQDGAGRVILAKRADGNLAAMIDGVGHVAASAGRQDVPDRRDRVRAVREHAGPAGDLVGAPRTDARRDVPGDAGLRRAAEGRSRTSRQVFTGSGDEEIRFHNGSRILFGARERGFGRGIPGVDILIFDEAQILSDRALSNMLATMNTSRSGCSSTSGRRRSRRT